MGSTSSNSPNSLELSLSLKPSYVPKSISNLLSDLGTIDNVQDKFSVLNDYLKKYEEEVAMVEPFKRELPQCMLLLMDAIEMMKGEITKLKKNSGEEESAFEYQRRVDEFLKFKKSIYEDEQTNISPPWSSYQENGPDIPRTDQSDAFGTSLKAKQALEIHQQERFSDPTWKPSTRRHWTDELQAKFLLALSILGGEKVATPKQIREVMRVKGLTTDQIKSHLQKYRLHTRTAGQTQNQVNSADQKPAADAPYDQSYNHRGIWAPTAQVHPLYAPSKAQTSTANNDQQNGVVTTNGHNSDDSNYAGWLNHLRLSGSKF